MLIILTRNDITDDFRSLDATSIEVRHFCPHRQMTITDAAVVLFKDADGKLLCLKNRNGSKETDADKLLETFGAADKEFTASAS